MSPDVFLSRHQIRYDGFWINGTPAAIVTALQTINAARAISSDGTLVNFQYRTPGFAGSATNPNTFTPAITVALSHAVNAYTEALKTGVPQLVYSAVDLVNTFRQLTGGAELIPPYEVDILAHRADFLGQVIRALNSLRAAGDDQPPGSPLPWFDTIVAFDELRTYDANEPGPGGGQNPFAHLGGR